MGNLKLIRQLTLVKRDPRAANLQCHPKFLAWPDRFFVLSRIFYIVSRSYKALSFCMRAVFALIQKPAK